MKQPIYMDANATTAVLPEVLAAMQPFWSERFGNASAVHSFGRRAKGALELAREQLATLLHARPAEITFTSGGTESDNLALFGTLHAGDHLVVGATEHDAVLHAAEALAHTGVGVTRVACDAEGRVSPDDVIAALTPQTRLVSVMLANNETGAVQPVREITTALHEHGALLHTDAIQACGKMPVDVQELGCDLLSISAHKMYAPQGVGALWVRSGVQLSPLMHGGSHERRKRAGTENIPGIVGFGAAALAARQWLDTDAPERLRLLRDRLQQCLLDRLPNTFVNASNAPRLPNTLSIRFAGIRAEELVIALDMMGLAVSGGSACQSGTVESSHVLLAMGLSPANARSSIRLSLTRHTSEDEVLRTADLVVAAVERLRAR